MAEKQSQMWEHWKSPIIFTSYLEGVTKLDFIRCLRENLKRRGIRFDKFPTDIDVLKKAKQYMNDSSIPQEVRKEIMERAESCCNKWSRCFCCKQYDVPDDSSTDEDNSYEEESEEDEYTNTENSFMATFTDLDFTVRQRYFNKKARK